MCCSSEDKTLHYGQLGWWIFSSVIRKDKKPIKGGQTQFSKSIIDIKNQVVLPQIDILLRISI